MWRQLRRKLPFFLTLGLTACGGSGIEEGQTGFIDGFFGGIVIDEPRAALVARDVLSAGGNAADAATAAYFTMAVTMPGGASLGGGGMCLVYDRKNSRVETVEFLARTPASGGVGATVAVPGNVRGMFLVQARYGRLNWADLLVPAENLARDGHAISRAFARDLQTAAGTLRADPEARRIFALDSGAVSEGTVVQQIELAAALSVIRTRGAGEFYGGQLGRQFVEAVGRTGAKMTIDDLRSYRPRLVAPLQAEVGDEFMYFPPPPVDGGVLTGQIWAAGQADDRYDDAQAGERVHLLSELAARAYSARTGASGEGAEDLLSAGTIAKLTAGHDGQRHQNNSAGGLAVVDYAAQGRHDGVSLMAVDREGQAVACSFSLNRPFGASKIASDIGILLAASPVGQRASLPSAVLVVNPITDQIFFGAAMSGGSPSTLAAVTLDTLATGRDFGAAVAAARSYNTGSPDVIVAEPGLSPSVQSFLEGVGYSVQQQEGLGRVNGFRCPKGLPRAPNCQFVADPRAHGLAISADEQ